MIPNHVDENCQRRAARRLTKSGVARLPCLPGLSTIVCGLTYVTLTISYTNNLAIASYSMIVYLSSYVIGFRKGLLSAYIITRVTVATY